MKILAMVGAVILVWSSLGSSVVHGADDSKMKQGAREVESGGKRVGQGVVDTARGIGKTVVGGAEVAGEKIREAGEVAKPKARNAWESVRDGSVSFGRSVKAFFTNLFDNSPSRNEVRTEAGATKTANSIPQ